MDGTNINPCKTFSTPMRKWNDIDMVEAVARHDVAMMERFYNDCKAYFNSHVGALFLEEARTDDVFQETMIHLWREIETHRIEIVDGALCRWNDGQPHPMTSSLLTFLLAIAKRKNWEQLRKDARLHLTEDATLLDSLDRGRYAESEAFEQEETDAREKVVADSVLNMSDRCRQILTLFYYEQRSLDEILALRAENTSKVGLKTSKYKCMQRLRQLVSERLSRLHLSV